MPPETQNKYSKTGKALIGAAIAILLLWYVVNFVPSSVAVFATTEGGKLILFYLKIILFIASLAAVITVFSIVAQNIKLGKVTSIKFKGVEVKFEQKTEIDADDDED